MIVAADLRWFVGDRVGPDRLALWMSMRLSERLMRPNMAHHLNLGALVSGGEHQSAPRSFAVTRRALAQ